MTLVDSAYFGSTGGDYVLEINVMEAKYASRSVTSDMYQAVKQTVEFSYNNANIEGAIARHYSTDKSFSCGNLSRSEARTWLDNNGYGDGVYLWSVNCSDNGFADANGGWEEGSKRIAFNPYADDNGGAYVANIASHEGLHSHLYAGCDETPSSDHTLGSARTVNGQDYYTPMASGGGSGYSNGTCTTDDSSADGYTPDPSSCTLTALEDSRDHERGDHS